MVLLPLDSVGDSNDESSRISILGLVQFRVWIEVVICRNGGQNWLGLRGGSHGRVISEDGAIIVLQHLERIIVFWQSKRGFQAR